MGDRFRKVGAPSELAKLWFATLLRDGFALRASGDNGSFAALGADTLGGLLTGWNSTSYEYVAAASGPTRATCCWWPCTRGTSTAPTGAGLRTAWLNRTGGSYPGRFGAPEFGITALTELPAALAAAH